MTRRAGTHTAISARQTEPISFLWHDLRQSVAVILASAYAVEEDPSPSPEVRRWLRHISDEARRISRICEHAIRTGDAPRTLLSLDEVTLGVIDSVRVVFPTVIEYRPLVEDVNVDGCAVERALTNVVNNACKAAGPEGRVRIEIDGTGDGIVIITVDDSGPGFAAPGQRRAGLGLHVTRRMLDPLDGGLRISEHGPLGGARVQLHVDCYPPQTAPEGAA